MGRQLVLGVSPIGEHCLVDDPDQVAELIGRIAVASFGDHRLWAVPPSGR